MIGQSMASLVIFGFKLATEFTRAEQLFFLFKILIQNLFDMINKILLIQD